MASLNTPKAEEEFFFRLWVHPEDRDLAEVEVWYHGIERSNGCYVSDWAREHLENLTFEFWDLFDLTKDKHWQVVGKASIRGWFDYWGEYDEEMTLIEFVKEVVDDLPPVSNERSSNGKST